MDYEFDVPVSVVLKQENAEVFDNLTDERDTVMLGYTRTCKRSDSSGEACAGDACSSPEGLRAADCRSVFMLKTTVFSVLGMLRVTDATAGHSCAESG